MTPPKKGNRNGRDNSENRFLFIYLFFSRKIPQIKENYNCEVLLNKLFTLKEGLIEWEAASCLKMSYRLS